MRRSAGLWALGGLLLAAGCAPKAPLVTAPVAMDVAMVAMVAPPSGDRVAAAPPALQERIVAELGSRKLAARPLDASAYAGPLATRRGTARRLGWVVDNAGDAPLVLLVETAAFPFAQVEGRNRWTVEVTLSIARADAPQDLATSSFSVPVILQFLHEKEDRAVEEAAVVVERKLARLLDDYLGGLPTGP